MNYVIALIPVLAAALGGMALVYGGYDDSPGGQLIGAVFVVGAVVLTVRTVRRSAH